MPIARPFSACRGIPGTWPFHPRLRQSCSCLDFISSVEWNDALRTCFKMRPIIEVENIAKRYQLGHKVERYPTLRDAIVGMAKAPFKRFRELSGHHDEQDMF